MGLKLKKQINCDPENELGNRNENESAEENDVSEADDEVSDTQDDEDESGLTNSGWADSVSKILKSNKPKRKKSIVLSKAKKLTDIKKEKAKPAGFEVQTVEGEIKEEQVETVETDKTIDEPPSKKKKIIRDIRVKPNILEKDRERTLQKIATKGVVQLFNAVKLQQKQISEKLKEAGPLEVRKEKVLKNIDKRAFLNVLMGEKSQKVDDISVSNTKLEIKENKQNGHKSNDSVWSVLKDDFMLSAKMKDWDKEIEDVDLPNDDID